MIFGLNEKINNSLKMHEKLTQFSFPKFIEGYPCTIFCAEDFFAYVNSVTLHNLHIDF